jgi:hypothetical protein
MYGLFMPGSLHSPYSKLKKTKTKTNIRIAPIFYLKTKKTKEEPQPLKKLKKLVVDLPPDESLQQGQNSSTLTYSKIKKIHSI